MSRPATAAAVVRDLSAAPRVPPEALLIVLTILAATLRLYRLGDRGLWVDETLAAHTTQLGSLGQVIAATPYNRMPLDLLISWLLRDLGSSEAALRLPAAVFGMLLVPALFLLGRRMLGTGAGLLAALLAAVSPFAVWYSQEAAPYSLLMLAVTLQAWAAHRAAERARLGDWLLLALLTALSLYTHYTAALTSVAIFAWVVAELALQARTQRLGWEPIVTRYLGLATAGLLAVLAIAPWTPAIRAFLASAGGDAAKYAGGGNPLANLASLLDGLAIGWLMAALVLAGIWAARRRRPQLLLLSWVAIPMLALVATVRGGILVVLPRYLAEVWPALVLLAAVGAMELASVAGRRFQVATAAIATALALLLLIEATPTLVRWYGEPKDDWRGAAALVAARSTTRSPVLAMGSGSDWAAPSIGWYLDRNRAPRQVFDAGGSSSDNRSTTDRMGVAMRVLEGRAFAIIANSAGPAEIRANGRSQTGVYTTVPSLPEGFTRTDLVGVTVVEAPALAELLRWGAGFVPGVLATEAIVEGRDLPESVLPPVADPGPFRVDSDGPPSQRIWSAPASAQTAMVARFNCASENGADARVYVSAHDASGAFVALFPDNGGYPCQGGQGAFAFSLPGRTTEVKLWLRVSGRGSGEFSDVRLAIVPRG